MKKLSKIYGPLTTMKKLAVCAVLVFACVSAYAESKDFGKLSKIKEVEVMHIDKNMINLAAQSGAGLHIGDAPVDGRRLGKSSCADHRRRVVGIVETITPTHQPMTHKFKTSVRMFIKNLATTLLFRQNKN